LERVQTTGGSNVRIQFAEDQKVTKQQSRGCQAKVRWKNTWGWERGPLGLEGDGTRNRGEKRRERNKKSSFLRRDTSKSGNQTGNEGKRDR